MELQELLDELDELRGADEEPEETLQTIMVKIGQMAEADVRVDDDVADAMGDDFVDEMHRDLCAGALFAVLEYAAEHDIDVEHALEERMESLKEMKEQRDAVEDAKEENDAEALADALGAEQNEVPTGGEDEDDPRYIS